MQWLWDHFSVGQIKFSSGHQMRILCFSQGSLNCCWNDFWHDRWAIVKKTQNSRKFFLFQYYDCVYWDYIYYSLMGKSSYVEAIAGNLPDKRCRPNRPASLGKYGLYIWLVLYLNIVWFDFHTSVRAIIKVNNDENNRNSPMRDLLIIIQISIWTSNLRNNVKDYVVPIALCLQYIRKSGNPNKHCTGPRCSVLILNVDNKPE